MAHHCTTRPLRRLGPALALGLAGAAWAQTPEIVISSPAAPQISGFAEVPAHRSPFNVAAFDAQSLREIGAGRLSDALRLDASVSDAYNSPAYWDILSVRGFTLDNRYNFRREGLPLSAETMIALGNKERIELLKGTSGIQAGTSAPGGLAHYLVKRPPVRSDETLRELSLSHHTGQGTGVAIDLGGRSGEYSQWGYRLNLSHDTLNPYIRNTRGHQNLLALAMDWRAGADSRLEWEIEHSLRSQIGVNGHSLLGDRLPAVVDGRRNLTWQDWAQPGVFGGTTGTLRWRQNLASGWLWTSTAGTQRLRTDDRLVFAFGCSSESRWDRFCSDGSMDVYDYRSENERRRVDAFNSSLTGQMQLLGLRHEFTFSALRSRMLDRPAQAQAFNGIGTGSVLADFSLAPDSQALEPNTRRDERSLELSLQDRMVLGPRHSLWLGFRHTRLQRSSERTDGSGAVDDRRDFSTPWLALTGQLSARTMAFVSYGEGVELDVAPNRSRYINAGQALPALRSRQTEMGLKHQDPRLRWQVSVFDITRPLSADAGSCDEAASCTRVRDGHTRNRGLEISAATTAGAWTADLSAAWLHSTRESAWVNPAVNGQRSLNLPRHTLRAQLQYLWPGMNGLRSSLRVSHEGSRQVTIEEPLMLPSWTTLDLNTHLDTRFLGRPTHWTVGVDNFLNRHFWRESPLQFGHHYLYPGSPRTLRVLMSTAL